MMYIQDDDDGTLLPLNMRKCPGMWIGAEDVFALQALMPYRDFMAMHSEYQGSETLEAVNNLISNITEWKSANPSSYPYVGEDPNIVNASTEAVELEFETDDELIKQAFDDARKGGTKIDLTR